MAHFKVVNKYGKAVTVKMGGEEVQLFKTQDFARKVSLRLNKAENRPKWLVNKVEWKENRPYIIEETKY